MNYIRRANKEDCVRIAEIEIFNYRLNFYPIFQNDWFYFDELQVPKQIRKYEDAIETIWIYDDGVVKGFIQTDRQEVRKLFVEPALQNRSIGSELLNHAISELNVNFLWVLEKNFKAIKFYEQHGFHVTGDKKFEDDTTEYLIRLER